MLSGKLLWWDKIDQNGLIQDFSGNRYYVDSSTIASDTINLLKKNIILYFEINISIPNTPCAISVSHIPNHPSNSSKNITNKNLSLPTEGN